jgi:hypothetical protein
MRLFISTIAAGVLSLALPAIAAHAGTPGAGFAPRPAPAAHLVPAEWHGGWNHHWHHEWHDGWRPGWHHHWHRGWAPPPPYGYYAPPPPPPSGYVYGYTYGY